MLLYLLIDTSGSTVRHHVNAGVNLALPGIVAAVEDRYGSTGRFCLASYGSVANVHVPLTRAVDVALLPTLPAAGLTSLAAGFAAVGEAVVADREQLAADGEVPGAPAVVVVADGLPTDSGAALLAARAALDAAGVADVDLVVPSSVDALVVAGLRVRRHDLDLSSPSSVAASAVSAVQRVVARSAVQPR
jgi:uncharacterized protein YegL